MSLVRLSDLKPGDRGEFFALLKSRVEGLTRDKKSYFQIELADARRCLTAIVWADDHYFEACATDWSIGQAFRVRANLQEHPKYGLQLQLLSIRPVHPKDESEGFHPAELNPSRQCDPSALWKTLIEFLEKHIRSEVIRRWTVSLLEDQKAKLQALWAHPRAFHTYPGGWLVHTLAVLENCLWLGEQYRVRYPDANPPLNLDALLAAAALHDLGRAYEYQPDGEIENVWHKTIDGELFGPLVLVRDALQAKARDMQIQGEWVPLVIHIVWTHLSIPEWGSPRLPAVPEALILHHADDLDAKMEMFQRVLRNDPGEGDFTESDPVLKRVLWKRKEG